MPWYRLEDENGITVKVREMDHDVAMVLVGNGEHWRRGLTRSKTRLGTLEKVFKAMDAEGFTEESVSRCLRWWRRRRVDAVMQLEKANAIRDRFSEMAKEFTPEQRKVIGKFLSLRAAASFEAGLFAGMAAVMGKNAPRAGESKAEMAERGQR